MTVCLKCWLFFWWTLLMWWPDECGKQSGPFWRCKTKPQQSMTLPYLYLRHRSFPIRKLLTFLCLHLSFWICCRDFLDPGGSLSVGSHADPARSLVSVRAPEWLPPSQHKQEDLITALSMRIKLIVSTPEIANQMSYSECTQQGDGVVTRSSKRK